MTAKNTSTEKQKTETPKGAKTKAAPKTPPEFQWTGDYKDFFKQSLDYNRQGFESVFDAVESFQGKAEEYTDKALEQPYIPEEGKAQVKQWFEAGRKARTGFRDAVLKGHEQIEKWVTAA